MKKIITIVAFILMCIISSLPIYAYSQFELDSLYSQALKGEGEAAYLLANHYSRSTNNETNRNLTFKFLSMAVNGGYIYPLPELGECYYKGIGTEVDHKKAFECFNKALKNGNYGEAKCLYYLGECYNNGYGVKSNKAKAIDFYNKCSLTNHDDYARWAEIRLSELDKDKEYDHIWKAIDTYPTTDNVELIRRYLGSSIPTDYSKLNFSDVIISNVLDQCEEDDCFNCISLEDHYGYSKEAASEIYLVNALLYDKTYTPYTIDEKTYKIRKSDERETYEFILLRLLKSAMLGNKESYYHIGMIYTYHLGELEKGASYFAVAAEDGSKDAAYELALSLMRGEDGKKNERKALSILSQLSDEGHAPSIYTHAILTERAHSELFSELLLKSGQKGYSKAFYMLGYRQKHQTVSYDYDTWKNKDGVTTRKDKVEYVISKRELSEEEQKERNKLFIKYMTLAADMGNSDALWQLYLNTEEDDEAMKYLEKAADLGNRDALYALGVHHYNNEDYVKAHELWMKSAEFGCAIGMYNIGIHLCIEQNYSNALEYFLASSELNYVTAHNLLGNCYAAGEFVEKDLAKAEEYFLKFANLDWGGWYILGELCYNQATENEYKKAVDYYETALNKVLIDILDEEGNLCESKIIKNSKSSKDRSSNFTPTEDNIQILGKIYYMLGVCYRHGRGVEKNEEKAEDYTKKASALGNQTAQSLDKDFLSKFFIPVEE